MIHARPQAPASALEALALSERFVLWNLRAWACCCRGRRLPAEPVVAAFANIGAPAAAEALDAAMTRLVLATGRPLAVHCPPHPGLSDDELTLLAAAAAAQRHDRDALTGLFADLLSPPASALVGRSLMEFGAAIALVGVLLPQPGPQPAAEGAAAGWPAATLH
ncbi:hypothetical protein [Lichenibacterium dinghuense]|uniref:hypothetical protein n=1 Tax=Lichenibacterium dinghuense TaxID=2895977 RepID=UPI001F2E20B2|nr:hypothetical protein [Lichenibacterium sp. 6Y81]